MNTFSKNNNMLICRLEHETIYLCPWGKNDVRVISSMMSPPVLTDWALLPPAKETEGCITIEEDQASLQVGKLTVKAVRKGWPDHLHLSFYNQNGSLLFQEQTTGGALQRVARNFRPVTGGDYSLTAVFQADPNEKLFGMGQYQQETLDIKNCEFELAHRNSQVSIPFILSSKGYGFLWHNPAVGRANFAQNQTTWYAESTKQLDYWVTTGDIPSEIEEHYAAATGKVPMMPDYGMGFWQSKLRYWNQGQLLNVAKEHKKRNIPLDVIVCDFFHWPKMGDFRFEEEFFPDVKAMCKELEEMGIKLMVSVWPQISLESENFKEMKNSGYLVSTDAGIPVQMQFGGDSVFLDATNEEAQEYVWEKCKKNYLDKGVTLFWLDEAEPEYGKYHFHNYRYAKGPALQVSNIYPQQYSKLFFDGMQKEGEQKIVNLVRCAWAGSQRYGALVWSGDIMCNFETFRQQLCAGLSMGIAGIPWWTTDIGGFHGGNPSNKDFRELFLRWFEWGTFCPVMRLHGDRQPSDIPVYRQNGSISLFTGSDNEIWSFGDEIYPVLKKYVEFREVMRPYIRDLMEQAHKYGTPVMRTMFYEFPNDGVCWSLKDQYMFGPDLLVAPIMYQGADSREIYLPYGEEWTILHTGEKYQGGQVISISAPIHTIPVALKNDTHKDWVGKL